MSRMLAFPLRTERFRSSLPTSFSMSWRDFIRMLFNGEFSWRVYERVVTNGTLSDAWNEQGKMERWSKGGLLSYVPSHWPGHHIWGAEKRELHLELQRVKVGGRWENVWCINDGFLCVLEMRLGKPVIAWKLLSTGLSSLELRLWRLWLSLVFGGGGGLLWKQTVAFLWFWPMYLNKEAVKWCSISNIAT